MNKIRNLSIAAVSACILVSSCTAPKNVEYFKNATPQTVISVGEVQPIKLRPDDRLSIVVKSKDPAISDLFNLPNYSSRIGSGGTVTSYDRVSTYLVDPEGNIDFPMLGRIHVEGMTRNELSGYIKGEIVGRGLAKDPTVSIEVMAKGVKLLGDVRAPGEYPLDQDSYTILDIIAKGGDLNITGMRRNVKVLRKENGQLKTYVVDLTDAASLTSSPAYYMQQGDIIYVEPNEMQKRSTTVNGNNALSVGFWISAASLLTSVVTTIAVFINK